MTFRELKKISKPHFYCLFLDKYFPSIIRGILRKGAAFLALVFLILSIDALPFYFNFTDGLFFLCVFTFLALSFLEFFYRSMINEGLVTRIREGLIKENKNIDYALSNIIALTDEIDITKGFFNSKIGQEILIRSGISTEHFKDFIYSKRSPIVASSLNLENDFINLVFYAEAVYELDKDFQLFLSQNSVNKEEFLGTVDWIMKNEDKKLRKTRFWSRENLGIIPSIGTSWSYGKTIDLGKYSISLMNSVKVSELDVENNYRNKEIVLLEDILEKRREANVIIIDDDENVIEDIIYRFIKKIKLGIVPPSVENKEIIELDWNSLIASYKNKSDLERELIKIFNEAIKVGNLIIFIKDLAGFISSAKGQKVNITSLLSSYFSSSIPIIASAANNDFHFFIETVPTFLEKFERIIPTKANIKATTQVLLEQIPSIEKECRFFFSYPSIVAIANAADRFITSGEMPGKALDLLFEIAPWATKRKVSLLEENDVSIFISEKTGVKSGIIGKKEAEKIKHLEKLLHRRVIGQEEAISGVANAIRRSRSGISNPNRPITSFLFIGPTGVGKTEVSKALAESFFGNEKKMIRFDMSEFNGPDALSRLIGNFALNKTGILASKIRDNSYGILLLDEFEKSAPDILDLFLQILDEGVFTDALGRQVNCRNLMIIATSNAGSGLIWEKIKSGVDLSKSKEVIINDIISERIFKPELLNRFDGIIVFHPLQRNELREVARLNLEKLAKRLKLERDIELVVNEEIINFIIEKGYDPKFGGRSINRTIQNKIEDIIAYKIINKEVNSGDKLEIKREELE
ncbi:MAG: ATP-dependent Clp protease ATP-binding subunit [Candidatus Zambryskibacteria bacterium]|nr:ATP-dependent Clp protease ATP-binding subunit [Candidatus Zambryskibacteria bacterium]